MPAPLRFLNFDLSHDPDGGAGFDASASVTDAHWPALQAEVARVLDWADTQFTHARGPVEEGGQWDFELQGSQELSVATRLDWRPGQPALHTETLGGALRRHTVHLSLQASPAFADAFCAAFGVGRDDDEG